MKPLDLNWSFLMKKIPFKRKFKDKIIIINNVYFLVQVVLDGLMISFVFISNNIIK